MLLVTLLFVLAGTNSLPGQDGVEHVVLVSIDGLRPEFYLNAYSTLITRRVRSSTWSRFPATNRWLVSMSLSTIS